MTASTDNLDPLDNHVHAKCRLHAGFSDGCCKCTYRVMKCADEDPDPLGYLHKFATSKYGNDYQPKRANKTPERDLQRKEVMPWLLEHDISFMELVVKPSTFYDATSRRTVRIESPMRGWPDIICVIKGRFVGLELKIKSVQSDYQKQAQAKIEKGGGLYFIIRSVEDLENHVKPLNYRYAPGKTSD